MSCKCQFGVTLKVVKIIAKNGLDRDFEISRRDVNNSCFFA